MGASGETRLGPIVVGVDGSDGSRAALSWAIEIATRLGGELVVVHAYEYVPMLGRETNAVALEQARARVQAEWTEPVRAAGLKYETVCREGDARSLLTEIGSSLDGYLLVVGSRGHSQLAELVLGSVAHYLTHRSEVPVVVVPPGLERTRD